jgi:hypothetical protein
MPILCSIPLRPSPNRFNAGVYVGGIRSSGIGVRRYETALSSVFNISTSNTVLDLFLDNDNNVYLLIGNDTFAKYDFNNNLITSFNTNSFSASYFTVDSEGSIYAVGTAFSGATLLDRRVIKYNSNNEIVWQRILYTDTTASTNPTDIKLDGNGNIFVTKLRNADNTLFKINPNGTIAWQLSAGFDTNGVAFDTSNNITVITSSPSTTAVRKYDTNGNNIGNFALPNDDYRGNDIYIDNSNNVYIAGFESNPSSGRVLKYNSSFVLQWNRFVNSSPIKIAVNTSFNVYVITDIIVDNNNVYRLNASGVIVNAANHGANLLCIDVNNKG